MDIYAKIKQLTESLHDKDIEPDVYQYNLRQLVTLLAQLAVPGIRV